VARHARCRHCHTGCRRVLFENKRTWVLEVMIGIGQREPRIPIAGRASWSVRAEQGRLGGVRSGARSSRTPVTDVEAEYKRLSAKGARSLRKSPPRMGPVTTAGFDDTCGTSAKSLLSSVIPA
jgi:hypothetical protein